MNRNRTIAQQVGQRERRLARVLSSTSGAAAALPWSLGNQNRTIEGTPSLARHGTTDNARCQKAIPLLKGGLWTGRGSFDGSIQTNLP